MLIQINISYLHPLPGHNKTAFRRFYYFIAGILMQVRIEDYYLRQPEPFQSCLLALKDILLKADKGISHERKFQIPFFCYEGKKLAYLWLNRKKLMLGFVEDRSIQPLVAGIKNKDKYESIQIDPLADLPIDLILNKLNFYLAKINVHQVQFPR
jgi:hypothetical protein